jgi:hypothetical protein
MVPEPEQTRQRETSNFQHQTIQRGQESIVRGVVESHVVRDVDRRIEAIRVTAGAVGVHRGGGLGQVAAVRRVDFAVA